MPFINVQMLTGKTEEQKASLAQAITDAFVEIAQSKPEAVFVIFIRRLNSFTAYLKGGTVVLI